jgi:hypothetical protein
MKPAPFFPPPENPYAPEDCREVEIVGAMVFQVTPSGGKNVALAAMISQDGKDSLMRFVLPAHNRAVRRIFTRGGLRGVPRTKETFNLGGMVALNLEGTIIGEDNIREDLETKPEVAYVLTNVTAREFQ